jgi:hypothetical protein
MSKESTDSPVDRLVLPYKNFLRRFKIARTIHPDNRFLKMRRQFMERREKAIHSTCPPWLDK